MMYKIGDKEIRTVCIIGAGNVGHYLMAFLGSDKDLTVNVFTPRPEGFGDRVESLNVQTGEVTVGRLGRVSADPADVIPSADMILFAVPSNVYQQDLELIWPFVDEGTVLGFIPGTGGVEFLAYRFIKEKHCAVFGTQRVPSGTKVAERGKRVNALEKRRDIRVASIPARINADICSFIGSTLGIKTVDLTDYLAVTFTPSNPILHTCRLYGLFHDYQEGDSWSRILSFYKEWSLLSSEMLLGCNAELQTCCRLLDAFDLSQVASLTEHYEIWTAPGETDVERMTNKIRSLLYMKDNAPMCANAEGRYVPDFSTRYFTEDFPFGLAILRDFCDACGVEAPYMDRVLSWFDRQCKAGLYVDGKFVGPGKKLLPLPSNYGLTSKQAIVDFYTALREGKPVGFECK